MKIIVISTPQYTHDEFNILRGLFDNGLDFFHLRKPDFSMEQTREYLEGIPGKYRPRIILHHQHRIFKSYPLKGLHFTETRFKKEMEGIEIIREQHPGIHLSASFHNTDDIKSSGHLLDYIFLSPIFDSISKKGYKAAFKLEVLSAFLNSTSATVIALGGVDEKKIQKVKELGFAGAAVLGAVWNAKNPVNAFVKIKKAAEAA